MNISEERALLNECERDIEYFKNEILLLKQISCRDTRQEIKECEAALEMNIGAAEAIRSRIDLL
jgi:hypothetical protein